MTLGLIGQAGGMFAVTNIDDIVLLAVFFGRAGGDRRAAVQVVVGEYLGFAAILAVSLAGALGAGLLPESVLPFLGLVPLALGLREAWWVWRDQHDVDDDAAPARPTGPRALEIAGITLANGGDNLGVYVPVLAVTGPSGKVVYVVVFLLLVAVWCAAGRFLATRAPMVRALERWGHVVLPVVLIGVGLAILLEGAGG